VLDSKTGDYKQHFKIVPKDWHDWDVSNPPVLIRTKGGKQLMTVAPKDGHLHGFDLATTPPMLQAGAGLRALAGSDRDYEQNWPGFRMVKMNARPLLAAPSAW
jgi:glucose dehydrogenase